MIFEDFVMLGKTVPEPNSDGRVFVCSAGWSSEYRKLIRIYPLARKNAPPRWSKSVVRLERNPKDSRDESWRLAGDRSTASHESINLSFDVVEKRVGVDVQSEMVKRTLVDSLAQANTERLSLALVHPVATPRLFFDHNPTSPDSPALRLFDVGQEQAKGAKRFPYIPRLEFADEDGTHRLMLRDWGVFEFMRKHGSSRRHELEGALRLGPDSSLLVGNLNNQRTAWIVISVLNGLVAAPPTLFDDVDAKSAMQSL